MIKVVKKLFGILLIVVFSINLFLIINADVNADDIQEKIRSVSYSDYNLINDYSDYSYEYTDEGLKVEATKVFDNSIFESLDLVSESEISSIMTVKYTVDYIESESTIILGMVVAYETDSDYELFEFDSIPGFITQNINNEVDVLFKLDDSYAYLSDMQSAICIDNTGLISNIIKIIVDKLYENMEEVKDYVYSTVDESDDEALYIADDTYSNMIDNIDTSVIVAISRFISPGINLIVDVMAIFGLGDFMATTGAAALMMYKDDDGNYHASYDCWQEFMGYSDTYDVVFSVFTDMDRVKYYIDLDDDSEPDYILWGWKGDYLNMGAGTELGIYKRWSYDNNFYVVDKTLSVTGEVSLYYNGIKIINYTVDEPHWWLTAFNPNVLNPISNNLEATFILDLEGSILLDFLVNDFEMEDYIQNIEGDYTHWNVDGSTCTFVF